MCTKCPPSNVNILMGVFEDQIHHLPLNPNVDGGGVFLDPPVGSPLITQKR